MRKTLFFATFFLTAFALVGSPGLTWTCLEGQIGNEGNGYCAPGRVAFTGSGFLSSVHITVSRTSSGEVIDDYNYDASGGTIQFTETLVPADTYIVQLTGANGLVVSQNVTTGSGN